MLPVALVFLSAVSVSRACVATATTTTTVACCEPLTIANMAKIAPIGSNAAFEQCSTLRRLSSTCPTLGYLVCNAAAETNPASVSIQVISAADAVIDSVSGSSMITYRLYCVSGEWKTTEAGTGTTVTQVSCSQTGSTGTDFGNQDYFDSLAQSIQG